MSDLSNTVIRGYELKNLLGEGGFGAVYRAFQPAVKRDVALKVILPQYANHPDFIRSFESEAQIIARLEHLHIVTLYDYWREPDSAYLVMRLLRGGSLRKLIEQGPVPLDLSVRILSQVASALNTAHRQKIVHRDIKPDNILLDEEQNAFLTDFGIAKDLESTEEHETDDELTGSPAYFSPEQAMTQPVSPQSDIYSLGIVVFEMLTGSAPFAHATTLMEVIFSQINEPLPPLPTVRSDLPPELTEALDLVIQRATDKNPAARYPDALSFAADFQQAALPAAKIAEAPQRVAVEKVESAFDIETTMRLEAPLVVVGALNPYKGLRPFEEADAENFFGREELTQELIGRLRDRHFLAVIGPSGSGKSSVVKAGVLPALRHDALPGSKRWFIAEMVPSVDPFRELESALLGVAVRRLSNLQTLLRNDERGLLQVLTQILPDTQTPFLLVIDQFEEVFTQIEDEATRAAFLNSLLVATTTPDTPLRVIITMRADFYDRPLLYPGFGELIRKHSEVVLPLSATAMAEAILKPAENAGLTVEPALVSAIVTEVSEQPGALPLLQYALTEVFERREGTVLTFAAYQASGGVLGALARRAEELYMQLDAPRQEIVRQIFLRLVTLGEGTEDTRRRIGQDEIFSIGDDQQMAEQVLTLYSKYRLFTFDNDPVTRTPTVEVAHEALIREWQRLRGWLNDSRDEVRLQQRLASAAQEWHNQGRDPSFLASGVRLQQFESLLNAGAIALNELELAYTRASITERDRKLAEEVARAEHERRLEQRARRRLQAGVAVFLLATVVASILAVLAIKAQNTAQQNEATAVAESYLRATAETVAIGERNQAQIESSRVAAALALQQLTIDPVNSINLALQALPSPENPRPYVPEAEFALTEAIKTSLERAYLDPFGSTSITTIALGSDQIAVAGQSLVLTPYSLRTTTALTGHERAVLGVQWAADGRLLSYEAAGVRVWQNGEQIASYSDAEGNPMGCARWQPGGDSIAICAGSRVRLWRPASNGLLELRPLAMPVVDALWSADGKQIMAWDATEVLVYDVESETTWVIAPAEVGLTVSQVVWSPDGTRVAIISGSIVYFWLPGAGPATVALVGHTAPVDGALFVDNSRLITWGDDGTTRVWSTDGVQICALSAGPAEVNGVALSPDTSHLLTWQNDGTAHVWELTTGNRSASLSEQRDNVLLAAWRDDTVVATSDVNFQIRVWDTGTGTLLTTLYGHRNRVKGLQWLDERYLLSYSQDGTLRTWEVFAENAAPLGQGLLNILEGHRGEVEFARWLDDNTLLTNGRDGTARRWSSDTGATLVLPNDAGERWRIVWSPDGGQVLRYLDDAGGEVWDLITQTKLYDIRGPVGSQAAFWLEPGIFVGQPDGDILWLDAASGQQLGMLTGHTGLIHDAQFFGTRRLLATASADNHILIWQLPQTPTSTILGPRTTLDTEGRPPLRLTWSRDGVRLVSVGFNGDVTVWDTQAETPQLFFTGGGEFPGRSAARFSPDERYLAAPVGNVVFVWDMDARLVFRQQEDNAMVGVQWTQNDTTLRLFYWNANGFVRLWDLQAGVEVWHVQASDRLTVATINGDHSQVMTGGRSGRVLIWQAWPDLASLIETAIACCQTRSLTSTVETDN